MEANRFELEQLIMKCWNTADDVEMLYSKYGNSDMSDDEVLNTLLGIVNLHNLRCETLFQVFEEMCGKGLID